MNSVIRNFKIENQFANPNALISKNALRRSSSQIIKPALEEKWSNKLKDITKNPIPCHGRVRVLRYMSSFKLL